jgi:dihydroflavonol-4-reductase
VSLGIDRSGQSRRVNVEATRCLLDLSAAEGVERFVYTSTLWTTAAGTADRPADENSLWNLNAIRSPYCETKREAEAIVLERNSGALRTAVICPGLVVGARDRRPTSTGLLLRMARTRVAVLPNGGIPLVDARVLARAHVRALTSPCTSGRYIVTGPYQSYPEIAQLVAEVAGRPRRVIHVPGWLKTPLRLGAEIAAAATGGRIPDLSGAMVGGGFLALRVSGAKADKVFGLWHPPPVESIFLALDDHRRSGRAAWLPALKVPCSCVDSDH